MSILFCKGLMDNERHTVTQSNKNSLYTLFGILSKRTKKWGIVILPEIWTRGLVKKESNFTKRYEKTDPPQIFA